MKGGNRVIILRADGSEDILTPERKPTLKQMKEWVGGYIEPIMVNHEGQVKTMAVNGEGLLLRLPVNRRASAMTIHGQTIVGDVFILEGWDL